MPTFLKRLVPLVIAISVVAAPIAESAGPGDAVAGAAKKGKKCKSKKKGKKAGKKAKCKKQQSSGGSPGLPGKPVEPNPPGQPAPADPLLLESLQLTENPLLSESSGPGRVTISGPAPAGGQPVTLSSGDLSLATLPDAVHIAAGQTSAIFQVHAGVVVAPASVTLTAAIDGSVRTTQLDLVGEADLNSLALDYQCFPDVGQSFADNVVSLNVRAPSTPLVVVDLVSDEPFSLSVPSTVTVPAGSYTGNFAVNTLQTTSSVAVTATLDGIPITDTASVRDSGSPAPVASTLSLLPNSVVVGDTSIGTVSLDCEAPAGGITVSLADNHSGVTMPASVIVPEGALSASFPITTNAGATPGPVQITATAGAAMQATLTLRALGT